MVTKECNSNKYCCFYVSDYHLEMILLPYVRSKINTSKIIVCTDKELSKSMEVVLNKTNFTLEEKNRILNLGWNNKEIKDDFIFNKENKVIIVNGSNNYIVNIEKKIENLENTIIIHCYNITKEGFKIEEIKHKYKGILNTQTVLK